MYLIRTHKHSTNAHSNKYSYTCDKMLWFYVSFEASVSSISLGQCDKSSFAIQNSDKPLCRRFKWPVTYEMKLPSILHMIVWWWSRWYYIRTCARVCVCIESREPDNKFVMILMQKLNPYIRAHLVIFFFVPKRLNYLGKSHWWLNRLAHAIWNSYFVLFFAEYSTRKDIKWAVRFTFDTLAPKQKNKRARKYYTPECWVRLCMYT